MMQSQRENAIRPAAVAGLFYPSDPLELRSTVGRLLANAEAEHEIGAQGVKLNPWEYSRAPARVAGPNEADTPPPKALIAATCGLCLFGPGSRGSLPLV